MKDVVEKNITYIKRDRLELDKLRKTFNSTERGKFLKCLVSDESKIIELRNNGLTELDIERLNDGLVPKGYQVHHKLPLDDSGTNSFDNLVLIKNDPYHKVITNTQNSLTRGMEVGDVKSIKWPIPDGKIYPLNKN